MAKYKLTRAHNGQEAGESIEVNDDQKAYFQSVGLIKEEKQSVETKEEKQKYNNKKLK